MKPIIGISPSPSTDALPHGTFARYYLAANYVDAVIAAGGIPVILPPQDGHAWRLLDTIDGLLFSGGADVEPWRYGDLDVHPTTYGLHPPRDRFELDLLSGAIERDMPVLCICRGIQVLNVAFGGTLLQDIPDQFPTSLSHRQQEAGIEAAEPGHQVVLEPQSRLAAAYGAARLQVNSFHHQGLKDVPPALSVTGRSEDGLPEAVELPDRSFVVGVQWHPELMFHRHGEHLAPFSRLVEVASSAKLASVS